MHEILWIPFIIASVAVISIPGQDMMLIMTKSISEGTGAGVCTASGVSLGLIVHTLIVSFGLGSLIMASEYLFWMIKLAGAAYLFYLAYNLLKSDGKINAVSGQKQNSSWISLFAYGAVSNISNPKIMIFYLAFLPQFIGQGTTNPVIKMLILGLTFACLTFLIKLPVALFSGLLSDWFKKNVSAMKWVMRSSGGILFLTGIRILFEKRNG